MGGRKERRGNQLNKSPCYKFINLPFWLELNWHRIYMRDLLPNQMNHNTQACQTLLCNTFERQQHLLFFSTVRAMMDHYVASVLHYLSCYFLGLLTKDKPSLSNHLLSGLLDHPIRIRLWGAIGSLPVLSDLQSMAGGIRPGVGHTVRLTVT